MKNKMSSGSSNGFAAKIKAFFGIDDTATSIKTEVTGGIVTFLSMAYILIVNPAMISGYGGFEGTFAIVFTATAIAAIFTTILMGIYAKLPIALAPGMGLNAFFVFNLGMFGMGFGYYEALAVVFISGLLFLALSISGVRTHLINAIPKSMKLAMGAGIGFFIAFIGLMNAGIVTLDTGAGLNSIGDFTQPTVLLAAFGILLVLVLHAKKVPGGILIGMVATAVIGSLFNTIFFDGDFAIFNEYGEFVIGMPKFDFSNASDWWAFGDVAKVPGKMFGSIGDVFAKDAGKAIAAIVIMLFVDFFDTAGTIVAVGEEAGLVNSAGELEGADKALQVDAIGTVAGSMLGTSTVTAFVESGTGVAAGAKTGLASVVTGLCFLVALFIFPFFNGLITASVTAPALVLVGVMMFGQLRFIDWDDEAIAISSFFMLIMMIVTYAIYWGIVCAFIVYAVVKLVQNKKDEVSLPMWALSGLSVLFFILEFKAI